MSPVFVRRRTREAFELALDRNAPVELRLDALRAVAAAGSAQAAETLAAQIADGSILPSDNGAAQALLAACQISPGQCARVLDGAVAMDYTNRYLWATVVARAPGFAPLQCLAAFDRLLCH